MAVAVQRIQQNASTATLTGTFYDANGTPRDPTGPVTVHVTAGDGTDVLPAGTSAALVGGGSGQVTVALTGAKLTALNLLTASWTDAASSTTVASHHEICGGFIFSLAEARAFDAVLADTMKYPDALVLQKRQEVEEEVEWICDAAFVPRYRRVTIDGSGSNELLLEDHLIRKVRSATITATFGTAPQTSVFTADDLAALILDPVSPLVVRPNIKIWDIGQGNITVEYEHGYDGPAAQLKEACLWRLRYRLTSKTSEVYDRATTFTSVEGGTYRLDQATIYKTGMADVDAVYARYSLRERGDGTPVPVSRPLRFDQNRYSMFHGGRH